MPQIDDMRRLWSEGRDVSEIARMTGHNRKAAVEYRFIDDHGYPVGPSAPHHFLDGARAEVVGAALHGEAAGTHDGGAQYPASAPPITLVLYRQSSTSVPMVGIVGTALLKPWHPLPCTRSGAPRPRKGLMPMSKHERILPAVAKGGVSQSEAAASLHVSKRCLTASAIAPT